MSMGAKMALIVLGGIFAVLAVFLVIGVVQGDHGTDTNNSNVDSNNSQK